MIQRVLYNVLKRGIAEITSDVSILEDLFGNQYELDATEVASIKKLWETRPPRVVHGYADADQQFPLFCITLLGERETDKFIGDSAGDIIDTADSNYPAEQVSSIWGHDYSVWVYAEHPDVTLYYYEIAKLIIQTAGSVFVENAIMDVDVSGMDMAPDERYIPAHLFVRQLKFSCKRELLRIDQASKLGRAFRITGIHVDRSGSPSDVGGVSTNVSVFRTIGDDDA